MGETLSSLTPQLLVGIAVGTLASVVTLVLLYAGSPIFGPVNDLINAVIGFVIALLAWRFFAAQPKSLPSIVGLLLCWAGAALIIGNSVLVAFGRMEASSCMISGGIGFLLSVSDRGRLCPHGSRPNLLHPV